MQTTVVTRRGAQRVMRYAFELARRRGRRRYVHCVTKSNALAHVMELWDEVFAAVAGEYPDVRTTRSHVDSSSMYLISRPAAFDVLVTTNLMGDILSDQAAAVCGSIGLAASANLNPEGGRPGMFEPVHGSAPDIAGKGIANPLAAILAGALMLDALGEQQAARLVEGAVHAALAGGGARGKGPGAGGPGGGRGKGSRAGGPGMVRTPDLGGSARTAEVTDAVLAALG